MFPPLFQSGNEWDMGIKKEIGLEKEKYGFMILCLQWIDNSTWDIPFSKMKKN